MAYIPTEWATGDVITAVKLNKAENGIAAASSFRFDAEITYDGEEVGTLNKTFEEIETAFNAGKVCCVVEVAGGAHDIYTLSSLIDNTDPDQYQLTFYSGPNGLMLYAASKADYPSTTQPPNAS